MRLPNLCACQTYAGDYYVSNPWTSNGIGYFSLVSYDCDQSTTVQCIEANDPLPPTGHQYDNNGNYFYPNNQYYQTGYGNPVECCNAEWDHVNKGQDADCDNCNGSIIVDGDYNITGKFNVRYTYNGQTFEEGPFTTPSDITIDHLCGGTYTDITIVSVHTGCEDVWPHDITLGGGGDLHVDAGNDQSICRGESVQLCATGADHYEWSNGHTGTCITVSPHQDTNYSVTGTTNGCTDTDHVSVHVNEADVDAGDDQSICIGESVELCATGADHYEWSNGHTGTCITVSPHQDTNYSVTGTTNGCTDTDHVSVHVNEASVDAGNDQSICRGESVQLCATGADHYEWSNGHTGTCITVSPHQDTNYSVTGTTGGCTDTDHLSVHVNEAEWDHVEKSNDAGCGSCNGSIIVSANYGVTGPFKVSYKYDGEIFEEGPFTTGEDITIDHLCAGTYTKIKIISIDTGCHDKWPENIVISGGDDLHIDAGDNQSICRGESVQLCATGADHYEWSNGHTGTCITVNPHQDTNTL